MIENNFDVLVIGGGIAGAALAAQLGPSKRVVVLDMEEQPGYHSTGRSAAMFVECYGNPVIRSLTRASRDFFFSPNPEFTEERLVIPRKVLIFGREDRRATFEAFIAEEFPGSNLELIDADAAVALCPVLRREGLIGAILDHGSADVEVHALHQSYLRQLKRNGGQLVLRARVESITYDPESQSWTVNTAAQGYRATTIVNAAGAWADAIAVMAGAHPVGVEPRRRTAALVDGPEAMDAHNWPMILDADETFYMKPDAGLMLISPADETLSEPEDSQADELDVAIAAHQAETFTTIQVRHIRSKWAGLRTFVEDRSPVVGFDPDRPGFFWMAALGGYGIQTAPALSALAAKLVLRLPSDKEFARLDFGPDAISPSRFCQGDACDSGDPVEEKLEESPAIAHSV